MSVLLNLLAFTKLRKILFSALLIIFLFPGIFLLLGGTTLFNFIPAMSGRFLFFAILSWINVLPMLLYTFFDLPLKTPLWEMGEFGANPTGGGWAVIVLFWILVAFFLSWFGNLKRDLLAR